MLSLLPSGCGLKLVNLLSVQGGYERVTDIAYTDGERGQLDIYWPAQQAEKQAVSAAALKPVVLFLYGGSWKEGSRREYKFAAESIVSAGFIAVIPDYRLFPEVQAPGFVEDAAKALVWTHENIRQYGGDPNNIFIAGHSAGAHIAALLNLDERFVQAAGGQREWIAGLIGLAGPYDFMPSNDAWVQDIFGRGEASKVHDPIEHVDANAPPMLLLHGDDDKTVYRHNPVNLHAATTAVGGRSEVKFYPDAGHVRMLLGLSRPFRGNPDVLGDMQRFIEQNRR